MIFGLNTYVYKWGAKLRSAPFSKLNKKFAVLAPLRCKFTSRYTGHNNFWRCRLSAQQAAAAVHCSVHLHVRHRDQANFRPDFRQSDATHRTTFCLKYKPGS